MPTRLTDKQEQEVARTIGAGMRAARKREGMRQVDAAAAIGTAPEVYGRYERGHQLPSVPMLAAIMRALNAKPEELLSASQPQQAEPPLRGALARLYQKVPNTPEVRLLLRSVQRMRPGHIRTLSQLAADLAAK